MHSKSRKSAPTFWASSLNAVTLLTKQPACSGLKSLKWQQVQQCGFPFQISTISDKILQKNQATEIFYGLWWTTLRKICSNGATTKLDQKAIVQQKPAAFPFRFVKIQTSFHKTDPTGTLNGLRSTKPRKFKPKNGRTHHHAPPRICEDQRPSLSNLWKSASNFRKLIVPWSFTALDLQNLKFSAPESRPRADTRRRNVRLNEHAPPSELTHRSSLKRVARATHATCHTRPEWWHHPWRHIAEDACGTCGTCGPSTRLKEVRRVRSDGGACSLRRTIWRRVGDFLDLKISDFAVLRP